MLVEPANFSVKNHLTKANKKFQTCRISAARAQNINKYLDLAIRQSYLFENGCTNLETLWTALASLSLCQKSEDKTQLLQTIF